MAEEIEKATKKTRKKNDPPLDKSTVYNLTYFSSNQGFQKIILQSYT